MQSIIDACKAGQINGEVAAVIANRPGCKGLERAAQSNIPTLTLDHKGFETREAFDAALAELIAEQNADLVILAGFMRILTSEFVNSFKGRLLNIHPSLLPKYPGLHTHQRALDAGDSEAGATVHFVTPELDGGPAILQARVAITATDDAESLAARVLKEEHKIYPLAVKWYCEQRLTLNDAQQAQLDNKTLPECGVIFNEKLAETPPRLKSSN